MTPLIRSFGLGLLLAGIAVAGWQPIDSITTRDSVSDITCQSNARSVGCDAAGNIHVVWRGRIGGAWQLWYSRLDAGATQWSVDTTLTAAGEVYDPSCVVGADQSFYVCWNDSASGMLHLLKRDIAGQWTELGSLSGQEGDNMVSMASDDSGTLHVVWRREGSPWPAVYYTSYGQSGWGGVDTVATGATWPSVAGSPDGTVMVTWGEATSPYRTMSRRRVAGVWENQWVAYDGDQSKTPNVTWGGETFHAVWLAGISTLRVLVASWSEAGWGDTMKLSAGRVGQPGVSIAAEQDGALHVAWVGGDSSGPDSTHVQYRTRPSEGIWQSQLKLTAGRVNPQRVSMTAGDGRVQVAWSDQQPLPRGFAVRLRRYERLHDVGALYVLPDTVDSGAAVGPRAWLKNYGDLMEVNVPVWLSFSGYSDVETLAWIAPGDVDRVQFDTTILTARGLHVVLCSTALAGDAKPSNDAVRDSFFVRVRDVGVDSILDPDSVVYDTLLTPRVRVRNCGNVDATAVVHGWIGGTSYHDTTAVRLSPDSDTVLTLTTWVVDTGAFTFRCSVAYAPDVRHENDSLSKRFRVVARDVGVSAILSPVGTVDSGTAVIPSALVRNYGSTVASCSVRLTAASEYSDTTRVMALAPGESASVAFDTWVPTLRGTHMVNCSTMLAGDRNPGNDMQSCSVFVRVCDAAPVEILSPAEVISRGEVRPRARLANSGNQVASIPAWFGIIGDSGQVYFESETLTVGAGDTADVEFMPWLARSGSYVGVCSTALKDDMQHGNDALRSVFKVARVNAAALEIRAPLGTISEGWVEPRVLVANYGMEHAAFYVHLVCVRPDSAVVYADTEYVSLDTMSQQEVTFRQWKATPGLYGLLATVALNGDEIPADDTARADVVVESLESRQWKERAPVPRGPWRRSVKDGGCLVAVENGLLALKGANTCECYRYSAATDSWAALTNMPLGDSGHRVRAGASLCWDGSRSVFALKGNSTREFWRYDTPGDSWHQMAGLPEHTMRVKYGSGLVFVPVEDTDKVFLIKGSNTRDFLVYWVRQDEWHARRPLPLGPDSVVARHGTCLALLGGRIFCLKGRTTEFYEYFPDGDSWTQRSSIPDLGRSRQRRKPNKGAALASDGSRFLYAFKGGPGNEFWRYDATDDSWSQLDDIPRGNYRRKVGRGGALSWLGGRAYALMGGGSNEFWCFDPLAASAAVPEPGRDAAAEAAVVRLPTSQRAPGFVRCGRLADYPVPAGANTVLVIDAAGRIVARQAAVRPLAGLRFDLPGVYFVVVSGDSGLSVAKTMVVR